MNAMLLPSWLAPWATSSRWSTHLNHTSGGETSCLTAPLVAFHLLPSTVRAVPWSIGMCRVQAVSPSWVWEKRPTPDDPIARAAKVRGVPDGDPSMTRRAARLAPLAFTLLRPALSCWRQVYCSGELLATVQLSGLFEDSKEFVDMPMKVDPEQVLEVGSRRLPHHMSVYPT